MRACSGRSGPHDFIVSLRYFGDMETLPPLAWPRHTRDFDPEAQPVIPVPALPRLSATTLSLPFIRKAFSASFPWQVEPVFHDHFDLDTSAFPDIIPAAVCIPLVQQTDGLHVLFTRRSAKLYNHAGQICFPGGRIESTDTSYVEAAVRETWEEIGVEPRFVEFIGSQPSFLTSTRYTMKPMIGLLQQGYRLVPDHREVAEIFEVPLDFLLDPAHHRLHEIREEDGSVRHFFSVSWGDYFIWGATAALIRNLYHYMAAAEAAGLAE